MKSYSARPGIGVLGAASFAAAALCASVGNAQMGGAFAGLAGSWAGSGSISASNGKSERIKCRAKYSVSPSGDNLFQELRCASDSYKFVVQSRIVNQGGSVSGTWTEVTRNATGDVSGRVSGDDIVTQVSGPGFTAALAVATHGNKQTVSIRPRGTDITDVAISLAKD
jgi:hypothetical protein